MKEGPVVSVLIPARNSGNFLGDAIDSALGQTYQNIEVVVVNDGSSDNTQDVISSYGSAIKSFRIPASGANVARNVALKRCKGDIIQFLDADDILIANKFERQIPALASGRADLVFCKGYLFGDKDGVRPKKRAIMEPGNSDPFYYCLHQGLSTEGPLIKRSFVERVGGFTPGLNRAQERDFHIRLGAADARILLLDERLYMHRNHDGDRISNKPVDPKFMVDFFLQLVSTLFSSDVYRICRKRRRYLAERVRAASVGAFRYGFIEEARLGFACADRLSFWGSPHPRHEFALFAQAVGHLRAETARAKLLKILMRNY
ncbi:glycosyltransferase family 2 protein [Limibaculum sp. M0105]|uniref:Glycosyltransferase family 2 protein n=1 Tax=Thermohalobaculum xanthum TaxID=2753746 RepID=A0A8J7SHJ9_9RHOB|nr:glycosyltransferase family 2 protein [Thermohalobaculum xanthum]MBK0399755.1 glycosyltransferase family 2 protein [Thermohalobaculum xanthum]